MPFRVIMSRYEQHLRHEAHQLADLIVGVNQGTNGEPRKVSQYLTKLRNA